MGAASRPARPEVGIPSTLLTPAQNSPRWRRSGRTRRDFSRAGRSAVRFDELESVAERIGDVDPKATIEGLLEDVDARVTQAFDERREIANVGAGILDACPGPAEDLQVLADLAGPAKCLIGCLEFGGTSRPTIAAGPPTKVSRSVR